MYFDSQHARDVMEHKQCGVGLSGLQPLPETDVHAGPRAGFLLREPELLPKADYPSADTAKELRVLAAVAPPFAVLVRLALHERSIDGCDVNNIRMNNRI